ncbi:MAG: tRNA pseudouridine(55) synthase TruB [Nitriliruptor sp.]|nr:MAG: tRNA pseudouridine(55) synthase TruB [Nitriliruptor sp.]
MGRRPRPRGPVHDLVLVVDKPAGPTSHDVVARIRRVVGHSRVGHTGTLDPAATGVLVVCLGRATKLVRFLQAGSKTYAARIQLGLETDSQDTTGVELARIDASHLDEHTVCEALSAFQGSFEQVPPMVSAVKVGGERLHTKARRGETVERTPRAVEVSSLVLDGFTPGTVAEVSVLLTCSAGTYVRTIAHDVGAALGVGGCLASLRRIANGPFTVDEAVTLDALDRAGPEDVLARGIDVVAAVRRTLEVVEVTDDEVARRLTQGGSVPPVGHDGPVALVRPAAGGRSEQLLAVVADDATAGRARPELVWTRPEELR